MTLLSGDGEFVDNGDGTWTITPAVDFVGNASLSYTVEDADGGTSAATAPLQLKLLLPLTRLQLFLRRYPCWRLRILR